MINSATDRRGYVLERMFTKFSEITQYNGHYVVQGYSSGNGVENWKCYVMLGCMNVTDRRQTDDRRQTTDRRTTTYSEREHEFTFAKKQIDYKKYTVCK